MTKTTFEGFWPCDCGANVDPNVPHLGNKQYKIGEVLPISFHPEGEGSPGTHAQMRIVAWHPDTHTIDFESVDSSRTASARVF